MIANSFLRGLDRRYWPEQPDHAGSYGVVTAADAAHSLELDLLLESIWAQHPMPVHVYDLGLGPDQAARVAAAPLTTVSRPVNDGLPAEGDHWQAWWKPLLIRQSPFQHTLWVDVDCVVLEPLVPLYALLTEAPVLTTDHFHPELCENHPDLYLRYPAPGGGRRPVNSGVVGVTKGRDDGLVSTWLNFVREVTSDPESAALVKWWDQGALNWAVRRCERDHLLLHEPRWNRPARRLLYRPGAGLLRQVADAHPERGIAHFAGPDKLHALVANQLRMVHQEGNPSRVVVLGLPRSGVGALSRAVALAAPDYALLSSDPELREGDADGIWKLIQSWPYDNCSAVIASGSNLCPHVPVIHAAFPDCRYLVAVRDPADLIESRLRAGIYWEGSLEKHPVFQQHALRMAGRAPSGEPPPPDGLGVLEAHVWEAERSGAVLASGMLRVPTHQTMLCPTEALRDCAADICKFLGPGFDRDRLERALTPPGRPATPTVEWAGNMVRRHKRDIHDLLDAGVDELRRHLTADVDRTPLAY